LFELHLGIRWFRLRILMRGQGPVLCCWLVCGDESRAKITTLAAPDKLVMFTVAEAGSPGGSQT
jgi:hypothetical protein